MKVLIVGSGGREAALAWAIARSSRLTRLRCCPGNAGIARDAECVELAATDVEGIVGHAVEEAYDLVVVGPEAPLVAGLADRLNDAGTPVFGPSAAASRVEGSKAFSKRFMTRHGVPTARFEEFEDVVAARRFLESPPFPYPLVVKADGLAAGKGVVIASGFDDAVQAAEGMLSGEAFGAAGKKVVVEECLVGREVSYFALADGERFVELATCQDYKRIGDGDRGLNTGGMGTYSPSAFLDESMRETIRETIVRPTIDGMASEGMPYRGVLFVGIMLTTDGPRVLEYNARFGDPETQVLVPRLDGDWLEILHACATGALSPEAVKWKDEAAVCVVLASGGYPGSYTRGVSIEGLESFETNDASGRAGDVMIFHAGTSRGPDGGYVTSGGRVLGVTALGANLAAARRSAYDAVGRIRWEGEQHRSDIALDAVRYHGETR